MLSMVDALVNRSLPRKNPKGKPAAPATARKRMSVLDRERHIVDGAIQFFARHGFDAQMRDLAKSIGVTHALLYHYFPTKQALVDRVYLEVFEGRWKPEWEQWLDDDSLSTEDKFTLFYIDYAETVLTHDFVRILIFSGLTDQTITNRFFDLLRERLFPRLIRETRRYRAFKSRAQASVMERELLMGLHGSIFYSGLRRWVYSQTVHDGNTPAYDRVVIRNQVRAYLQASREVLGQPNTPRVKAATPLSTNTRSNAHSRASARSKPQRT
ncbi:TetR family transcriptional regulator [Limnohabitans sp. JirII-31]|nr:TetR family transcriptional regulator [Limnohabitans sp. JirII-31]